MPEFSRVRSQHVLCGEAEIKVKLDVRGSQPEVEDGRSLGTWMRDEAYRGGICKAKREIPSGSSPRWLATSLCDCAGESLVRLTPVPLKVGSMMNF
jgi:hypothetical protein